MTTPREVVVALFKNPGELLLRRWNWKSAAYSSTIRAAIFFFANQMALELFEMSAEEQNSARALLEGAQADASSSVARRATRV